VGVCAWWWCVGAEERHAKRSEMLVVGVAVLYVFIQANITGCARRALQLGFRNSSSAQITWEDSSTHHPVGILAVRAWTREDRVCRQQTLLYMWKSQSQCAVWLRRAAERATGACAWRRRPSPTTAPASPIEAAAGVVGVPGTAGAVRRAAGGSPAARFDHWARQQLCTDGEEIIGKYARHLPLLSSSARRSDPFFLL